MTTTSDRVADHVGIARDTVYRWVESKGLPAHRIERLWKFKLSEVDDWVRAGGTGEPPHPGSSDREHGR